MSDWLEAAGGGEPRSNFMRDGFVLDEAVFSGRLNGLFVKALRVQFAAFDPRDLGCDQGRAVPEILRAILRPYNDLPAIYGEIFSISDLFVGRCGVVLCCPGKCGV